MWAVAFGDTMDMENRSTDTHISHARGLEACDDSGESVAVAAEALAGGGVIVVPTDTVYGLASLPAFPEAAERIYQMKDRPRGVPLQIIIGDHTQLDDLGVLVPPVGRRLVEAFWPGALTVVFGVGDERPDWLAGRTEVGVRLPDRPFLQQLAAKVGPLAVTSSNLHGQPTATSARAATESLTELPDLLVDGGTLTATPSTVVNIWVSPVRIERHGAIGVESLTAVIGPEALSQES